ncbi:hypothetical protein GCM10010486_02560 [Nonomuraea roseoviolacea subsp. carminata]
MYIRVANGRKIRPSRGQIHVWKTAPTRAGRAIQMMKTAMRGKIPANMANKQPMGASTPKKLSDHGQCPTSGRVKTAGRVSIRNWDGLGKYGRMPHTGGPVA